MQVFKVGASLEAADTVRDLCILRTPSDVRTPIEIGSTDSLKPGDRVGLLGYPHALYGRVILTQQDAQIGAKILLSTAGIKVKHVVVNIQVGLGQSGSPVFLTGTRTLVAVLIGSYVPSGSWCLQNT